MPKLSEVFSGDYLKADDLKGRSVRVTISRVELKEFDDGKKLILHFEGKDKCMVCNKTNASIIQENLGSDDTDDWEGKAITMVTKKVEFQGKLVPAIRILLEERAPEPEPRPAPPADFDADTAPDDIPFS
jgi:hypothetical protein